MHFLPEQFAGLPESRDRRGRVRRTPSPVAYLEVSDGNGGIVINVSETGMAIAVAQTLVEKRIPLLSFRLPQLERTFQAVGEIVWQSDSKKSAGVRFVNLPEQDRLQIRNWIRAEIVAAEMQTPRESESSAGAKPVLVMPSPRPPRHTATRQTESDAARDEQRAAEFDRMFPSEASLHALEGKGEYIESPVPQEGEDVQIGAEAFLANQDLNSEQPELVTSMSEPDVAAAPAQVASAALEGAEPVQRPVPAQEDWREAWERFHLEREEFERGRRVAPIVDLPAPPATASHVPWPARSSVLTSAAESSAAAGVAPARLPEVPAASLPAFLQVPPSAPAPPPVPSPVESAVERAPIGRSVAVAVSPPEIQAGEIGSSFREVIASRLPVEQFEKPMQGQAKRVAAAAVAEPGVVGKSRKSGLSITTLGVAVVLVCFALGYSIQPGAFRFVAEKFADMRDEASKPAANSASSSASTGSAEQKSAAAPGVDASTNPGNANSAVDSAPTAQQKTETPLRAQQSLTSSPKSDGVARPADLGVKSLPAAQPTATTAVSANAGGTQTAPAETHTAGPRVLAATPASTETSAPVPVSFFPVTAPSIGSPPKLIRLPEETVSETPAVLIRSHQFLFVPAIPGPESTHALERVHVGDRIVKVNPTYPLQGADKAAGGMVHLHATIGPDGTVSDVQRISGPTDLIPAAIAAVRQWRYKPTDIDGKPIAIEEDITIEFRPSAK